MFFTPSQHPFGTPKSANQFGKKRKACQYVACIGTMLLFDGAGTVGSGETALEAACAGCHRCIYIVRMRSRLEVVEVV